jgi:rhodanese-related sulfurtransferase
MELLTMRMIGFLSLAATLTLNLTVMAESISTTVVHDQLSGSKQTVAKLYLTATEAYDLWKSQPEKIKVVDVRTVHEYAFVGHPEMAYNVPLLFATRKWDPMADRYTMEPNKRFLEQVQKIAEPEEIVLVTCRSGQRSKGAADLLTEAGYKHAYSIVDGFEGDKVKDSDSEFVGQRKKNGWRNAGLPWTYSLDPQLVYRGDE